MKTACLLLSLLSLSSLVNFAGAQTKPAPPRTAQAAHQKVQAYKASVGQKFVKHSKPVGSPDGPVRTPIQ